MSKSFRIRPHFNPRIVGSLVGSLNATLEVVIPASLFVRELEMFKTKGLVKENSKKNKINQSQECNTELPWWIQQLQV